MLQKSGKKAQKSILYSVMVLAGKFKIILDKGWGNPDRNVVAKTMCCW